MSPPKIRKKKYICMCFSCVQFFTTPCQAPPTMGFSRQEHCRGLPCPSPGIYIYIYMINFASWIQYWTIWYKWDYFLEIGSINSKESACQCRRPKRYGLIPGSGWSPGIGNGNPFQYSCLENSIDRGVWRAQSMGLQRVEHNWVTEHSNLVSLTLNDFQSSLWFQCLLLL